MGHKSSKESTILSAFKSVIVIAGADITDEALCALLHWAADQGFTPDPNNALSPEAWKRLGDALTHEVASGDKNEVDLLRRYVGNSICYNAEMDNRKRRKGTTGSDESEDEGSEGAAADD